MAATIAIARQGEPLDALIWRTVGAGIDALPAILAATPGLAAIAAALPEGFSVTLPEVAAAPATLPLLQLWD